MKRRLEYQWYLFLASSILTIATVAADIVPGFFYYSIILIGLQAFYFKLRYVNGARLSELNYLTIVFDLLMYCYYLLIGSAIWFIATSALLNFYPEQYALLFPNSRVLYAIAGRAIIMSSSIGVSLFIGHGLNHAYRVLHFTNKVDLWEVMLILISLTWLMFDLGFIGMYVSAVSYSTAPDYIKGYISRLLSFVLRRKVDLVSGPIQNNPADDKRLQTPTEFILQAAIIMWHPILFGLIVQLPWALVAMSWGSIVVPIFLKFWTYFYSRS